LTSEQLFRVRSLRTIIRALFEPRRYMTAIETHHDVSVLAKIAIAGKFAVVGTAPPGE
jgi:hypothetical protein